MNIYDKNHPHNAVFCEMLQSAIDGTPKTMQYRRYDAEEWSDLDKEEGGITLAGWSYYHFYRVKPPEPVIITRTVTYLEPITVVPAIGTEYFVCLLAGVVNCHWSSCYLDKKWLAAGVCHLTRKAAQKQWDAYYKVQK